VETKVHVVQTERTAAEEPKGKLALQDRKDPEEQRGRQEVVEPTDWLGNAVPPEKLDHEVLVVLPENLDPWALLVLLEQRAREEVVEIREMTVNPDKLVEVVLEVWLVSWVQQVQKGTKEELEVLEDKDQLVAQDLLAHKDHREAVDQVVCEGRRVPTVQKVSLATLEHLGDEGAPDFRDLREKMVSMENPEKTEQGANEEKLVEEDQLDREDNRALLEYLASPDHRVKVVQKENLEHQALMERVGEPVSKDQPVSWVAPVHLVYLVVMETWDLMVHLESKEIVVVKEKPEPQVSLACPVHKEHPDCQDLLVQKEQREGLVQEEPTVQLEKKAVKALVEQLVTPEGKVEEGDEGRPEAKETKDGEEYPVRSG